MRKSNPKVDLLSKAFHENSISSINIIYDTGELKNISVYVALQIILNDRNRQIKEIIFNVE